jgi:hypothetical protein
MPSDWQIGELQNRWVEFYCFVECDESAVFESSVGQPHELPDVIVDVVPNMQDWFFTLQNLERREHRTVSRLIERPRI